MHKYVLKLSTLAVAALMTTAMAGFAGAAQYHKPTAQNCVDEVKCPSPQAGTTTKAMQAQSGWKFDPATEQRARHRSDHFRFAYGGFWYPQPYWLNYGLSVKHRIACADGRAILRDHGFDRIKPIECRGGTFTYLGHRHGDNFRVLLSSRTGRIVNVKQM